MASHSPEKEPNNHTEPHATSEDYSEPLSLSDDFSEKIAKIVNDGTLRRELDEAAGYDPDLTW
jgi:hypothetical protein